MPLTEQQWQNWLQDADAHRIVLAEVYVFVDDGSGIVILGAATEQYNSPHGPYDGVLQGEPFVQRSMAQLSGGRTSLTVGDLEVNNADGRYDALRSDLVYWSGRDVILRLGDPSWPYEDFRVTFRGKIDTVTFSDQAIIVRVFDKMQLINQPYNSNLVDDDPDNRNYNQPRPLCYGHVFNIKPVMIESDSGGDTYFQIHDGPVVKVADNDYKNGDAYSGSRTDLDAEGMFYYHNDPGGTITVDAFGADFRTVGKIIRELVSRELLNDPADLDVAAFTQFDIDYPGDASLYLRDRVNLIDAIESMIPLAWHFGFNRSGLFTVALLNLDPQSATPDLILTEDETYGELTIEYPQAPAWRIKVGYNRNWTIINIGLDQDVDNQRQAFLDSDYEELVREDTAVQTRYPDALEPEVFGTALMDLTAANTEADRLFTDASARHMLVNLSAFAAPYQLDIGSIVQLQESRYGLNGLNFVVVGLTEYYLSNRVELQLWR